MMNEITLNKQLSGRVIKDAILYKISSALDKDSTLADYLAFNTFAFSANIIVNMPSAVIDKATIHAEDGDAEEVQTIADEQDEAPEGGGWVEEAVVKAKMEEMAPNAVRLETEQPLTVQVQEGRRVIERQVHYKREKRK